MKNKEFFPGASILNIDVKGSPSLLVNWKIHETQAKHLYFAIQMNQDETSTVVQVAHNDNPNGIIMEFLIPPDIIIGSIKTEAELEEHLQAKKAAEDVHVQSQYQPNGARPLASILIQKSSA